MTNEQTGALIAQIARDINAQISLLDPHVTDKEKLLGLQGLADFLMIQAKHLGAYGINLSAFAFNGNK